MTVLPESLVENIKREPLSQYQGSKSLWCRECSDFSQVAWVETGTVPHPDPRMTGRDAIIHVYDIIGSCGHPLRSEST